jgi:hypothetical protein
MGLLGIIFGRPATEDAKLVDLQGAYQLGVADASQSAISTARVMGRQLARMHDRYLRKKQKHPNTEQTLRAVRDTLRKTIAFWKEAHQIAYITGEANGIARARAQYAIEIKRSLEEGVKHGTGRAVVLIRSAPELSGLSINAQVALEAIAKRIES